MRLLFLGDIVGKPGRNLVCQSVRRLVDEKTLDWVIVNAENSAGGSGLTPANYKQLIDAGIDGITLGDHIYRRREIATVLQRRENIVKPANFPAEAPGREFMLLAGRNPEERIAVFSLLGRQFMRPTDCPWKAAERVLAQIPDDVKAIFVDFHAEATSEKQIMARYLDGRVTAVLGTHTHVPTADECILPGGTAFQCDLGMCGPYESIIGRRIDRVTETTISFNPTPFDVATGDVRLCGAIVDFNLSTGQATGIERLRVDAPL